MNNSPNFFIIGGPKCGTTSLAKWLSSHSYIYMSPWKEPRYFDIDLKTRRRINRKVYAKLFNGVSVEHIAIGEATVWYLYSKKAVINIEKENPCSRYIVMVRNPLEMAYSLHEQMTLNGSEHIRSFPKAWRKSTIRRNGKGVRPWSISEPRLLDYQKVCLLGDQLERLYSIVPQKRVLILVLDDIKRNARNEYERVLDFLGVPDDGRKDFSPSNPAKRVRSYLLQRLITFIQKSERVLKAQLGSVATTSKITQSLNLYNKVSRPRPSLPQELRKEMEIYFSKDVCKLGMILGRDFLYWLRS